MKLFKGFRGPRIGTKLMLLSLTLLVVPWFSYRQLLEMERLLVQGQSQAQLLTAEGISTLFNGREDLFNDLPVKIEDYESLFAHPLENGIRHDGNYEDWGDEGGERLLWFGAPDAGDGAFRLALGERGGQLHVFVQVMDPDIVYRSPEYLRLDYADHLRLSFIRSDGGDGRISLVFTKPGDISAYRMNEDWRLATPPGDPETAVRGAMKPTASGWNLEFRLPLTMLGSRRHFAVSLADVDDAQTRQLASLTQTLPKAGNESFNLVVLRSPEVLNIIQGLGYSGARILVIDAQQRVRAEAGAWDSSAPAADEDLLSSLIHSGFEAMRPVIHRVSTLRPWGEEVGAAPVQTADDVIGAALAGRSTALRSTLAENLEIIMAAHPIVSKDAVIGAVVVEQNIDHILSFQRAALEQVILFSVVSLLAVLLALLAFAGRLAWRIRHLRREASTAIDRYGRLQAASLQREVTSGDEIGDLARSISNMLSKLHQHNHFLENMPRTLRHEINNPLNTLSTSLQNLAEESPAMQDSKYLASAKSGVIRIGSIVQNLADAANLEESLKAEELEIVDVRKLLKDYVANCSASHIDCEFVFRGVNRPVYAEASDFRIEQMLDKIIDNALDFHRPSTPITVQLDVRREHLRIVVANRGPVLPDASGKSLFDSMVSHRGPQNRLHFGLGLYVVRVIAEHHGGHVRAMNLADGSGVAVMAELPLAAPRSLPARREKAAVEALPLDRLGQYRAAS